MADQITEQRQVAWQTYVQPDNAMLAFMEVIFKAKFMNEYKWS